MYLKKYITNNKITNAANLYYYILFQSAGIHSIRLTQIKGAYTTAFNV